jgi:hypothetical protein
MLLHKAAEVASTPDRAVARGSDGIPDPAVARVWGGADVYK